ncbi:D-glycero-beta-D-manno-heptose 1,7-bisphosphate 7-phosphatase [Pollutimonas sp. M17]|uniref:D-glycero-beta-D-manno-heptose 1,7-bisphosphate 7-phosphatase n=1 Tax=Pollutimonas sp. M17 TaxID=2962065 RepID=UPI0021F4CBC7|nr:D-glycero-beta-D-manno-heptose 1,7-bisphosphate 7-phosphatase [Pollutimonas sp. M17]UYO94525.1 D-glycero-beta-D-manno-heptose 1,7-bisphosphate 7-phosphatase [Pollutimonas sp. M17]
MKLAILDRDGVINQDSAAFIKHPDEWIPLPGSLEAIARLSRANWRVVIASNQSGLARGLFSMDTLNAIHAKMRREAAQAGGAIDAIFVCPHGPDDDCGCRKPRTGLFVDIGRRYDIDLKNVPAVGDSLRDLQAASQAGCVPWLVLTGNGEKTRGQGPLPAGTEIRADLASVVDAWLTGE